MIKIPSCNDIFLAIKFSRKIFVAVIIFSSNQIYRKIPRKKLIFQVPQTEILFPQIGRLLNISMNHFCLLYCTDCRRVERVCKRLPEPIHVCSAESSAHQCAQVMAFLCTDHTIVPVNAALSIACLLPYSSALLF